MDPKLMTVLIVAIVMIASIIKSGMRYGGRRTLHAAPEPDAARLKEEVRALKDRVAVLERIATDKHNLLEQEFDRLRDAPVRAPSRES